MSDDAPTTDDTSSIDDASSGGDTLIPDDAPGSDVSAPVDAGPLDAGPPPAGHLVLIGHATLRADDSVGAMVANSVLLSERPGTLRVLDYMEYLTGTGWDAAVLSVVHGAIDARAGALGRSVTYRELGSAAGLAAALAEADVLIVHPQLTASDAALRAAAVFWRDPLVSFLADGGIVVVTGYAFEHALVSGPGLFTIPSASPMIMETMTVVATTSPIVVGVVSPYPRPADGAYCYASSAGGALIVRSTTSLCPVVRHLVVP